jgi:cytochrome c biogenesis factor
VIDDAAPVAKIETPATAPIVTATPVVTVDSTAARAILLSLVTGALRIGGTALVAHGVMTQGTADAVLPAAAQEVVGTIVLMVGQFWAWLRAQSAHNKTLNAALADPSQIVIK